MILAGKSQEPEARETLDRIQRLIALATAAGAEAADAIAISGTSESVSWRLGKAEEVERSEGRDLGLRVLIGRRQAFVSTTEVSEKALKAAVERAVAMARAAPDDPYCGLADADLLATELPDLDLADPAVAAPEQLIARARTAEAAALAVPGVTNSEGASADSGSGIVALATSQGFAGAYVGTQHSTAVSVVAGSNTGMERDYDFMSARYLADLDDPAAIGRHAGELAVRRLNPHKIKSTRVPIVFAPRVAHSLLGHLASAISGPNVARGTSFLKDKLDEAVFAPGVRIVDDPRRPRGLRSRPFDGEGIRTERCVVVEDGRLTTWLLDTASARQLGLRSTGHARRGTGSPPSPGPSNFYLEPGPVTPAELMSDITRGVYVTELIGFGINPVTGDYSRGASGFWIENGEIAYPVSEITIAGNLIAMFRNLSAANDLVFKYGTDAPTVRIEGMTVAGQ